MILVLTLGIGLVEKTGLMESLIKTAIHTIPKRFITQLSQQEIGK